ncbi:MAG: hypothetical protein IJQ93_09575, partial [Bacteroidales bacterium]|nr:hypothetical protein [Bacteroidales bacterium]
MAKTLIAFYSRRGQNWVDGSIRNLPKGNNEVIVEKIKALLPDADVFRIDTVKKYSEDYMVCIEEAKQELRDKARPELTALPHPIVTGRSTRSFSRLSKTMKNFFLTFILALCAFSASAQTLVVYYSRTGQNYTSDGIVNLKKGNTQVVAEQIQKLTKAD